MGCCCSGEDKEKNHKDCCKEDKNDKNHMVGEKRFEKETSKLPLAGIVNGH